MKGVYAVADRFNVVKRGYDMAEVDEYISSLEEVVKSYKDKDTAIKNALISAEMAADNIILNAKNRSYEMKENSVRQIHDILASVSKQKEMLDNFQREYEGQVRKYLHGIVQSDMDVVRGKIDALESFLYQFTQPEGGSSANS